MKVLSVIFFSIFAVALQLALFSRINLGSFSLNLILSGALAYAVFKSEKKNYWPVLILILFYDLLAGNSFGLFSLSAWVSFFFIDRLGRALFKQNDILSVSFLMLAGISFFELFLFGMFKTVNFFHLAQAVFNIGNFWAFFTINFIGNGILGLFFWFLLNKYGKDISLRMGRKV